MWITNGGAADLFTVFAKVDGKSSPRFWSSAFAGSIKPERKKRRWASRAVPPAPFIFDNVQGAGRKLARRDGRGHIIAFNILNLGRLKLGPFAIGGAKNVLAASIRYAKERVHSENHCRVRADSAQARGNGDSPLRRRNYELSQPERHGE